MLLDVDFALARIGVQHRDMELADAYYMIQKFNESNKSTNNMEDEGY